MSVEEISYRKAIFANNKAIIDTLNQNPNDTAHYGPNFMSDWTREEKNMLLGSIPALNNEPNSNSFAKATPTPMFSTPPPVSVDW